MRIGLSGLLAVIALAVGAPGASAAVFTVDSTAGTSDAGINGDCDVDPTADDDCTLVAAIEEANATAAADAIGLSHVDDPADPDDVAFSTGQPSAVVSIAGTMPTIIHPLTINGGNCAADFFERAPCAQVGGGWVIDSDGEVAMMGLAFSTSGTAIDVAEVNGTNPSLADFRLLNSWFGMNTNGTTTGTAAPSTSVLLEDVDGAEIGGDPTVGSNIFARHATAIDIFGADNTEITTNRFGVLADGSFARAGGGTSSNHINIEITGNSSPTPDDQATGTVIGGSDPFQVATPECEGACNLILAAGQAESGAGDSSAVGIDMSTDASAGEIPADDVVIVGNHIGAGNGVTTRPSNFTGIKVGAASNVRIGGPAADDGDRNLLGSDTITSGDGLVGSPTDLLIQNNVARGRASAATFQLTGGARILDNYVSSQGIASAISLRESAGVGFVVQGNVIGEDGAGNVVDTGAVGIRVDASADGTLIGGSAAGQGNRIVDLSPTPGEIDTTGISIAADGTVVDGNVIGIGSDGSPHALVDGISIQPDTFFPGSFEGDASRIGGTTPGSENLISNVRDDAIVVKTAASDDNQILRNRGSNNGGQFIDLGDDGVGNLAEPNGPNLGAQAPTISVALANSASGTAAPGSTVRVFKKANGSAGEVESFVGAVTANGAGTWAVPFGGQPDGTLLVATATLANNTSELSSANAVDAAAPQTSIDSGPLSGTVTSDPTPEFGFSSNEVGSSFECRVDAAPFGACSGPGPVHTTQPLSDGAHSFEVRATDAVGNTDSTPALRSFTVDTTDPSPSPSPEPSDPPGPGPSGDKDPPETSIDRAPKRKSTKRKAKFEFSSSEPGSRFECKLDKGEFGSCASRAKFRVKRGKHILEVRAVDAAGNTDQTPAKAKWKVRR